MTRRRGVKGEFSQALQESFLRVSGVRIFKTIQFFYTKEIIKNNSLINTTEKIVLNLFYNYYELLQKVNP